MVFTLSLGVNPKNPSSLDINLLESWIRSVLELRELSPGMEAQIQDWVAQCELSEHENRLLNVFFDALEAGYIRRAASDVAVQEQ